jgi:hypothetical protein
MTTMHFCIMRASYICIADFILAYLYGFFEVEEERARQAKRSRALLAREKLKRNKTKQQRELLAAKENAARLSASRGFRRVSAAEGGSDMWRMLDAGVDGVKLDSTDSLNLIGIDYSNTWSEHYDSYGQMCIMLRKMYHVAQDVFWITNEV